MRALALRLRPRLPRWPWLGMVPQAVAILLCLGLAGAMVLTPTRQLFQQRDRIDAMRAELSHVRDRNRVLQERIARLNDPDYLEQQARAQNGLVRPGEIAWVVMPPSRQAQKAKEARRRAAEAPAPPPPTYVERLLVFLGLR